MKPSTEQDAVFNAPSEGRDAVGRLVPGENLKTRSPGRPRGTSESERIRQLIEPHRQTIIDRLVRLVKEGTQESAVAKAAEALLERLGAKPRPQAERIFVPGLATAATLQAKSDAILAALANGLISAEAARATLALLADYARIVAVDELEARIRALEGSSAPRVASPSSDPAPVQDAEIVDDAESLV